jgi:hypothetical protein
MTEKGAVMANARHSIAGWCVACLLIGGLAAGGLFLVWLAAKTVYDWQAVQSWQAVDGQLEALELVRRPTRRYDRPMFEVQAQYRYTINGRTYTGHRLGPYDGRTNVDSWHPTLHARLAALRSGAAKDRLTVWVDPQDPTRAMLDRQLRWPIVVILAIIGLFLLGLSALMLHGAVHYARGKDARPELPGPPADWRTVEDWQDGIVTSDGLRSALLAWVLPLAIGGLIAATVADRWHHGEHFPPAGLWLLAAGALLCGGLALAAALKTLRYFRHGQMYLRLYPFPSHVGQPLRGQINLPDGLATAAAPAAPTVRVSLLCLKKTLGRTRHDGSTAMLWEAAVHCRPETGPQGSCVRFDFAPPATLPSSEWRSGLGVKPHIAWQVRLEIVGAGVDRLFEIPLLETKRVAVSAADSTQTTAIPVNDRTADLLADRYLQPTAHGWEADSQRSPALRRARLIGAVFMVFALLCMAGLLIFGGGLQWRNSWDMLLSALIALVLLVPAALGGVLALIGISLLTRRVRTAITADRIDVERSSWLWACRETLPCREIADFVARANVRQENGARSAGIYEIAALLRSGRKIEILWAIADAESAEALKQRLRAHCLRHSGDKSAGDRGVRQSRPGRGFIYAAALIAACFGLLQMPRTAALWDGLPDDAARIERIIGWTARPGIFANWLGKHGPLHFPPHWLLHEWLGVLRAQQAARQTTPAGTAPIKVPIVATVPAIDGRIDHAEWVGATALDLLPASLGSRLYLRSDGQYLYLAADVPPDTTAEGFDQLRITLHNHSTHHFQGERIFIDRGGSVNVLRSLIDPASKPGQPRWISRRIAYDGLEGATTVSGHRQYEMAIDLAAAGLDPRSPFNLWVDIEGDPLKDAAGKFKARSVMGRLGDSRLPLWLQLDD